VIEADRYRFWFWFYVILLTGTVVFAAAAAALGHIDLAAGALFTAPVALFGAWLAWRQGRKRGHTVI
jgi:hypothetical protein